MNCLYTLYEEDAQDFLKEHFGRKLTRLELYRMKYVLHKHQEIDSLIHEIIDTAGCDAIDNSDDRWICVDEEFHEGIDSFAYLNCKE